MGRGDAGDHALHRLAHLGAPRDRQRPHRSADPGRAGNHVPGACRPSSVVTETTTESNGSVSRDDDLLQVRDHLRRDGDGVDGLVRVRTVTSAADDLEREQVGRGHHRARRRRDVTRVERGEQMHAGDEVGSVEHARLDDRAGSAGRHLLGVLEDEAHLAGELVAALEEQLSGAEQHRRVTVVAAGVHDAGPRRDVRAASFSSRIGSASMSARSTTTLPGRAPWSRATTAVPAGRSISSPPNERSVSSTKADVSCSSNDSSGWACRCRRHAIARASRSSETRRERGIVVAIGRHATGNIGRRAWVGSRHGRGRHDGQDRLALQAARLRVPVVGDLRRARVVLRLRPLRRAAQGQRQAALAVGDGAGARRHRRARLLDHPPPPGLGGIRPRRWLHRSPRRLQVLQEALPRRPSRGRAVRPAPEQAARRDLRLRPDRGPPLQPHVRDPRRRDGGDGRPGLPPPGDGAGHLHQLQERGPDRAPEAAVRHRPGRQVLPQRDHAGQLHLPHPRVRADGDGVLRAARRGRRVVPLLGATSATPGTAATGSARATSGSARTTPTSSRTTRAGRATSSTSSRSAGRSSRASRTAATSTSPPTRTPRGRSSSGSSRTARATRRT